MGAIWWRSLLSLLVAVGILAVALPAAFGSGRQGAGVDPVRVLSSGPLIAAEASGGSQLSIAGLLARMPNLALGLIGEPPLVLPEI